MPSHDARPAPASRHHPAGGLVDLKGLLPRVAGALARLAGPEPALVLARSRSCPERGRLPPSLHATTGLAAGLRSALHKHRGQPPPG